MTYPDLPPPTNPPDAPPPARSAPAASAPVSPKRASLVRVSDVAPEQIDWLWDGHLARRKLHSIDGDPDLGKSTITLDWASRVTTGKPWPDGQPGTDPAGVVFISIEEGIGDTIRPRLAAAGADLERVAVLDEIITGTDPTTGENATRLPELPTDLDVIADSILSMDAALLVIDPLMAVLPASINAHKDQDVRRALSPLKRVAEQTRAAVLIVRHLNKGDGTNPLYRGGGSIGIVGATRISYLVGRHPGDPDNPQRAVIAGAKANICARPASLAYSLVGDDTHRCARIDWEGEVDFTDRDLLRPPTPDAAPTARNARWLLDYLTEHGGEAPFTELRDAARDAGIPERTLRNVGKRLGVVIASTGFPRRTTWSLPTTASPATNSEVSRTGRTGRTGGDVTSSATDPDTCRTGRIGPTGRTGTAAIGPCADCGRPTRRYGDHADGTLCTECRSSQGEVT